jgi:uncharacterized protein with ParB-like and HNH nuclease domain
MNNNNIEMKSISELLDGRYFFIPSYQRGYRWEYKQIEDLLNDLYSFAIKPNKKEGEFYCLQPVIVQKIKDDGILKKITPDNNPGEIWEVVDGQQRLTTIYILYKYLLEKKGWDKERLEEEEDGKEIFHLVYDTRKSSADFLEKLDEKNLDESNIDYYNISNAYKVIDKWIKDDAKAISQRYNKSTSLSNIRDNIFKLLNCDKELDEDTGSVQIIWYELNDNNENEIPKSPIDEFLRINTGKIALTSAELIKALFLQKRNFESGEKDIKQLEIAMEWESIENILHKDDFWYYLNNKENDLPNRIDFLFSLIYKADKLAGCLDDNVDRLLNEQDEVLKDKDTLFRYYNEKFDGLNGNDLQQKIRKEWSKIIKCFRTLEDWYEDPVLYNYIGFLSQCKNDIVKIYIHFCNMSEESTREDFEAYLKGIIKKQFGDIRMENGYIITTYSSKTRDNIYKLLLFFNVNQMNEQLVKLKKGLAKKTESGLWDMDAFESGIYKFPFDIFVHQQWDVEHIDSATTNQLKQNNEKIDWINTAKSDLRTIITKEQNEIISEFEESEKYDELIRYIKLQIAREENSDSEEKNDIGNLTLLDASTNRSFGNSLFCTKRRIIIERIKDGTFVPANTQLVFAKYFDKSGTDRSYWTNDDKINYHNYIVEKLHDFLS